MKRYLVVCIALAMLLGSVGIAIAPPPGPVCPPCIDTEISIVNGLSTNEVQQLVDDCGPELYVINANCPVISFMATDCRLPDPKDVKDVDVEVEVFRLGKMITADLELDANQYKMKDHTIIVKCDFKDPDLVINVFRDEFCIEDLDIRPLDFYMYVANVKITMETCKGPITVCDRVPIVVRQNEPV